MKNENGIKTIEELQQEIFDLEKKRTPENEIQINNLKDEIQKIKNQNEILAKVSRAHALLKRAKNNQNQSKDTKLNKPGYRNINDFQKSVKIKESNIDKALSYIAKLSKETKDTIYQLLLKVKEIQESDLTANEKALKIKSLLWTEQNVKNKIIIGGLIGTLFGLAIFGTGGIGIAGLGSAIGVWGFLAGTMGGVLISSLIANFENKK